MLLIRWKSIEREADVTKKKKNVKSINQSSIEPCLLVKYTVEKWYKDIEKCVQEAPLKLKKIYYDYDENCSTSHSSVYFSLAVSLSERK